MTAVVAIAFGLLVLAGLLDLARLLRPGTLADRAVALDALLLVAVAGVAVYAAWTRSGIFLDVLVVTSLLAFVGTVMVARFIDERGG